MFYNMGVWISDGELCWGVHLIPRGRLPPAWTWMLQTSSPIDLLAAVTIGRSAFWRRERTARGRRSGAGWHSGAISSPDPRLPCHEDGDEGVLEAGVVCGGWNRGARTERGWSGAACLSGGSLPGVSHPGVTTYPRDRQTRLSSSSPAGANNHQTEISVSVSGREITRHAV